MLNLHTKAKEGFQIVEVTADTIAHVSKIHNSYGFFFFFSLIYIFFNAKKREDKDNCDIC